MDNIKKKRIAGLLFSKDRAMQLCAVIESLYARCSDARDMELYVVYKASSDLHRGQYAVLEEKFGEVTFVAEQDFKRHVLEIVGSCEHIMFLVDDNIFVMDFRIADALEALRRNPEALGFSLRLGRNTYHCFNHDADMAVPSFERVGDGVLRYDWAGCDYDFGYPLEVSSSIYRSGEIMELLEQIDFVNPNTFEGMLAANRHLYATARPLLLCFDYSVAFCNPLNLVQSVCVNRTGSNGSYSAENLASMFAEGYRIDTEECNGLITSGCHQDVEISFRRDSQASSKSLSATVSRGPSVTVEMTAYNAAKYIGKAIESVLGQTFEDLELLIVDDGSTDGTGDVVAKYADSRIRYIRQEHCNCASARNRVISESRGEYLLCVDSDDFAGADYLKKLLAFARRYPLIDYFYPAKLVLVDGEGSPVGTEWKYHDFGDNSILPSCLFGHGASLIPNPGSLKRRSMFERTGGYELLDTVEDFAFLCANALKINFKMVDIDANYFYRRLETGLSRRGDARDRISAQILNEMISIYPAEVICPDLAGVGDGAMKRKRYFEYLAAIFYKHAGGYHMVSHGDHFRKYGDFYQTELSKVSMDGNALQTI